MAPFPVAMFRLLSERRVESSLLECDMHALELLAATD
jgi:hypothetical protein